MRRVLKFLGKCLAVVAGIAVGAILVILFPPVAIGFMAVAVAKTARNPYEAVVLTTLASIVATFLVLNLAEVAVIATTLSLQDAGHQWSAHIAAA